MDKGCNRKENMLAKGVSLITANLTKRQLHENWEGQTVSTAALLLLFFILFYLFAWGGVETPQLNLGNK